MNEVVEAEVEALRDARGSAAELKVRLVSLRSELPQGLIFVFEGDDDRGIYLSWFRQIDAQVRYEPFSCGGKAGVLRLWDAVKRDINGLSEDVYFFVDRDFDDLRGAVADNSIYMTDCYSVESYLVTRDVLDQILKVEFHCHSSPAVRHKVMALFETVYEQFLGVSRDYNRDLHVARTQAIELRRALPKTVSKLASVELDEVTASGVPVNQVIVTEPEITPELRDVCALQFDALDAGTRYRGKFSLAFLRAWLEKLAVERRRPGSPYFEGLNPDVKVSTEKLTLATLAARSDPPIGLAAFLERAAA